MSDPRIHTREFTMEGPCSLEIECWPERRGSLWKALPWRRRLAWHIRGLADRIDRQVTYAIHGSLPTHISQSDLWDAIAYSGVAAQKYLNDLHHDRMVGGDR